MRTLRKKFRKIKKPLKRIVIKPKLGRWCNCYAGKLPCPTECSYNKEIPITRSFKDGKVTVLHDRTECVSCNRAPAFIPWKRGKWDKIKEAIQQGEDLRDMDPPEYGMV